VRTLADAALTGAERRAVERFARMLADELGADLRSVWLYGSRARGERPQAESDVDLLVVARRGSWRDDDRIAALMDDAAAAERSSPVRFSVHVYDPEHLEQRRRIRSFFIQEVDRDKIVLAGDS
jgi:predicted nucleotidyltransferase